MRAAAAIFAGALATLGAAHAEDPAPAATPPLVTPSRAVGDTHHCERYYPDFSQRDNEAGDVRVRYDVLADGTIAHVVLLKSSGHPRLDAAAIECVSQTWRNTPATRDGIEVASPGHEAIIRFVLRPAPSPATFFAAHAKDITTIAIGIAAAIVAAGILLFYLVRPRARRRCTNCGTLNVGPSAKEAPRFCTTCGQALPS